jgi:hypothetical protein
MEQAMADLRNQINQLQGQLQAQQHALNAVPLVPQAAPIQGPTVHIKPDRPAPFSGKKSESLEGWIFQMQKYCDLLPVPQENHIAFAGTFFKDQAALWWRSYHQTQDWQNAAPTWEQFLEAT